MGHLLFETINVKVCIKQLDMLQQGGGGKALPTPHSFKIIGIS